MRRVQAAAASCGCRASPAPAKRKTAGEIRFEGLTKGIPFLTTPVSACRTCPRPAELPPTTPPLPQKALPKRPIRLAASCSGSRRKVTLRLTTFRRLPSLTISMGHTEANNDAFYFILFMTHLQGGRGSKHLRRSPGLLCSSDWRQCFPDLSKRPSAPFGGRELLPPSQLHAILRQNAQHFGYAEKASPEAHVHAFLKARKYGNERPPFPRERGPSSFR